MLRGAYKKACALPPSETSPVNGARLPSVALHIVARLRGAACADIRARYDAGVVASIVRRDSRGCFGPHALRDLAKTLSIDISRLRRYARVTDAIQPPEFEDILKLFDSVGRPPTWSHFEGFARVRPATLRRQLALEVVTEGLSVRMALATALSSLTEVPA